MATNFAQKIHVFAVFLCVKYLRTENTSWKAEIPWHSSTLHAGVCRATNSRVPFVFLGVDWL